MRRFLKTLIGLVALLAAGTLLAPNHEVVCETPTNGLNFNFFSKSERQFDQAAFDATCIELIRAQGLDEVRYAELAEVSLDDLSDQRQPDTRLVLISPASGDNGATAIAAVVIAVTVAIVYFSGHWSAPLVAVGGVAAFIGVIAATFSLDFNFSTATGPVMRLPASYLAEWAWIALSALVAVDIVYALCVYVVWLRRRRREALGG
ncbi:MAG: hypothetical protein GC152_05405 [Alphaproteobacteria bacterium]|nr:hypothetical protein [Alphaproteobacteria bacterium]